MIKTLYKRSHLIASGILFSVVTIGSAAAMSSAPAAERAAKTDVQTLGRFVVSAKTAVFVPAAQEVR